MTALRTNGRREPSAELPRPQPRPDVVLEAYGESCGVLEPKLWARIRQMRSGQILEVRSDLSEAREGIASWCWLTGNALVGVAELDARRTRYFVRRK